MLYTFLTMAEMELHAGFEIPEPNKKYETQNDAHYLLTYVCIELIIFTFVLTFLFKYLYYEF